MTTITGAEKMEKTPVTDISSGLEEPQFGKVADISYGTPSGFGDRRASATEYLRDHNQSAAAAIDPKAERSLVWKFVTRILPVLAVMYLFNSLDKSNLGDAKTAGLTKSLNFSGTQYNIILSIFYIP